MRVLPEGGVGIEDGNQKSEVRSQKSEAQKPKARKQKAGMGSMGGLLLRY